MLRRISESASSIAGASSDPTAKLAYGSGRLSKPGSAQRMGSGLGPHYPHIETGCGALMEDGSDAPCRRGVTLSYLLEFAAIKEIRAHADTYTVLNVVNEVIVPGTTHMDEGQSRYSSWYQEKVPEPHRGYPEYFIIHTWSQNFAELVDTLEEYFEAARKNSGEGSCHSSGASLDDPILWLDIFALSQSQLRALQQSAQDEHVIVASDMVRQSGLEAVLDAKVALMCIDMNAAILSRTWCLCEAVLAVAGWAEGCPSRPKLEILIDKVDIFELLEALRIMDVRSSHTGVASDRAFLMQLIEDRAREAAEAKAGAHVSDCGGGSCSEKLSGNGTPDVHASTCPLHHHHHHRSFLQLPHLQRHSASHSPQTHQGDSASHSQQTHLQRHSASHSQQTHLQRHSASHSAEPPSSRGRRTSASSSSGGGATAPACTCSPPPVPPSHHDPLVPGNKDHAIRAGVAPPLGGEGPLRATPDLINTYLKAVLRRSLVEEVARIEGCPSTSSGAMTNERALQVAKALWRSAFMLWGMTSKDSPGSREVLQEAESSAQRAVAMVQRMSREEGSWSKVRQRAVEVEVRAMLTITNIRFTLQGPGAAQEYMERSVLPHAEELAPGSALDALSTLNLGRMRLGSGGLRYGGQVTAVGGYENVYLQKRVLPLLVRSASTYWALAQPLNPDLSGFWSRARSHELWFLQRAGTGQVGGGVQLPCVPPAPAPPAVPVDRSKPGAMRKFRADMQLYRDQLKAYRQAARVLAVMAEVLSKHCCPIDFAYEHRCYRPWREGSAPSTIRSSTLIKHGVWLPADKLKEADPKKYQALLAEDLAEVRRQNAEAPPPAPHASAVERVAAIKAYEHSCELHWAEHEAMRHRNQAAFDDTRATAIALLNAAVAMTESAYLHLEEDLAQLGPQQWDTIEALQRARSLPFKKGVVPDWLQPDGVESGSAPGHGPSRVGSGGGSSGGSVRNSTSQGYAAPLPVQARRSAAVLHPSVALMRLRRSNTIKKMLNSATCGVRASAALARHVPPGLVDHDVMVAMYVLLRTLGPQHSEACAVWDTLFSTPPRSCGCVVM